MNIFINSIFWILVLLVSVLGLISNKDHMFMGFFPMYMNALLVSFVAVALYELSLLKTHFKVNYKLLWPILILLLTAFTLFNSQLHVSSIWLDEYTQATNSLAKIDLVQIAANQQQPPLFYMLTSLSMKNIWAE